MSDEVNVKAMQPITENDKLRAAYALNMCNVSVSQIVQYNDLYILDQEYDTILNNLNLEQIPKDDALLNILVELLNTITFFRVDSLKRKQIERQYQEKMKNAIWSAVPNIGMIMATGKPIAMLVSLASQVGIGYMNYRKEKANQGTAKEDIELELQITAIEQFNALRRELFTTAWKLASNYGFPDHWRLTENQIEQYNEILLDPDELRKFARLESIKDKFEAYPQFWYYLAHTACYIAQCNDSRIDATTKDYYHHKAKDFFEKFMDLNKFNILREDHIATSAALEYADLLIEEARFEEAKSILHKSIDKAGNYNDILQLYALSYLKCGGVKESATLLRNLVNEGYNTLTNAKLLSQLYSSRYQLAEKESEKAEIRADYQILSLRVDASILIPLEYIDDSKNEWGSSDVAKQHSADSQSCEFEEITISSIQHILAGDKQQFRNQIIHIQAMIQCEGSLEFDNCIIHYGEKDISDEIKLTGNGTFVMKQCTVECHSYDEQPFIRASSEQKEITFENCEFINCCWFMDLTSSFSMSWCNIINPSIGFIVCCEPGTIHACNFTIGSNPKFTNPNPKSWDSIINCTRNYDGISFSQCSFAGDLVISEDTEEEITHRNSERDLYIIYGQFSVEYSSFHGLSNLARGTSTFRNSIVSNCYHVFSGGYNIEDCRFDNCIKLAARLTEKSQIRHCQFNNCFDTIVSTSMLGSASIEWCEFNNWRAPNTEPHIIPPGLTIYPIAGAMIELERNSQEMPRSIVSDCTFNGIMANYSYIVMGTALRRLDNYVAILSNCSFLNCVTKRKDKSLIKENCSYLNMLNKLKYQQAISTQGNCRGLSNVNTTDGVNHNIEKKVTNASGITIGSTEKHIIAGASSTQ